MDYNNVKTQLDALIQKANDKETIDALAAISNDVDSLSKEHETIINKNIELTNAYKEAILHSSFKDKPTEPVTQTTVAPDFDAILNNVLAEMKNNK